jgi:hypothetical protein
MREVRITKHERSVILSVAKDPRGAAITLSGSELPLVFFAALRMTAWGGCM